MGIVIDTGVFIAIERSSSNLNALRPILASMDPSDDALISSIALAELVHGIHRAKTPEQRVKRLEFVKEVIASFAVTPFTQQTAWIAGKVRGEQTKIGNTLPFQDSLIAATALEFDFSVLTLNLTDFERIPGIRVVRFTRP